MKQTSTVVGVIAAAGLAGSASAAIFTTYQDPAGDREFKYFAPDQDDAFGSIVVDTMIDFQVDLTEEGLGVLSFPGASFVKSADVSDASEIVPGAVFTAEVFNATFEIRDAGGELILAGAYGAEATKPLGGDLTMLTTSASLNANSTDVGGSLSYEVGDAIGGALASAGLLPGGAVDAVWTITALTASGVTEDGFFTTFEANSAFTGTIEVVPVPTPGAAGLLAAAGLVAVRRRR